MTIKNPTVFILGAGASIDYGYPSGEALVNEIVSELLGQGTLFKICRNLDFTERQIISFAEALSGSGDKSIDAFLERHSAFLRLGKVTITLKLIDRENENDLFSHGDDKWYGDVVNELKSSSVGDFKNNVSFLTFNYDRSFDHYLFRSIRNSYEEIQTDNQCAEIVNSIPLIHLHGQIGKLPWQTKDGTGRIYSKSFRGMDIMKRILSKGVSITGQELGVARHSILNISEQIKIIHEADVDKDDEFKDAHKLLASANNIIFLGFGYHEENLKRLKISELSPKIKRNIIGTSYELGMAKRRHINLVTNGRITLDALNYKIKKFLEENVDFE